jgi:hypothetical protein
MLALLTLITAGLYATLIAYFRAPGAVRYLGIAVLLSGLALVAGQSLRMMRYARLSLVLWKRPDGTSCNPNVLADRWTTAALWLAFGAVLLIVGLLIEGMVLFILFPDYG